MNDRIIALLLASLLQLSPLAAGEKFTAFKSELGLASTKVDEEKACLLIIVHHGDTDFTVEKRLQGWVDIPLNDSGRAQMQKLSEELAGIPIDAIYSSSLSRAIESAEILAQGKPMAILPALKGEAHGTLEGLKKAEYEKDPHFMQYMQLSSEEEIFFPVGEGGESKADVARRAIPALKEISKNHPGQTVVVVTHGGVLKFLNFLLGNYTPEEINEVPHGKMLQILGDGENLQAVK